MKKLFLVLSLLVLGSLGNDLLGKMMLFDPEIGGWIEISECDLLVKFTYKAFNERLEESKGTEEHHQILRFIATKAHACKEYGYEEASKEPLSCPYAHFIMTGELKGDDELPDAQQCYQEVMAAYKIIYQQELSTEKLAELKQAIASRN